jgi:hypothetical protein
LNVTVQVLISSGCELTGSDDGCELVCSLELGTDVCSDDVVVSELLLGDG